MRRFSFRFSLGLAVGALALAACSDSPVSPPTRGVAPFGPSLSATLNGNSIAIASDGSSQYCPGQAVLGFITQFPATQAGITSGCIAARDVETDGSLGAYNPGWDQLTGGNWIGFTVNNGPTSDYRPTPGRYAFQQTFTLPASVTNPSLSLDVRADNVVAVYLNGHLLGQQQMVDCNDGAFGPCHWTAGGQLHVTDANAADFVANPGVNYLTFLVIDLPTGYPDLVPPASGGKGGPAPQFGCTTRTPQPTGRLLFTNNPVTTSPDHVVPGGGTGHAMSPAPTENVANPTQVGCENPLGLAFTGSVNWVVPPPPQVCDFITFGRLVLDVGGDKVVISGNAGGNSPGGGILGEIQISIGKVDYHVHTIDSYGLTTNAPLFPDPFARVITGMSGAHTIELRLRDNPNPGQGEPGTQEGDKVWLKIDGVVVVPTQTLDKGNIQLHLNCRGPKD